MRIFQLSNAVRFGDAIGNHILTMKACISQAGFATEVYAKHIDARLPNGAAKSLSQIPALRPDDILLYHMASYSPLNLEWLSWGGKKIMMYHNITPAQFYEPYNREQAKNFRLAVYNVSNMAGRLDGCIAMSEFNKRNLMSIGFDESIIDVMPGYFVPFADYAQKADIPTLQAYADGWTNILFVGRIAPHKKQDDLVRIFAHYKKHFNQRSRLILVGTQSCGEYADALRQYAGRLGVGDIVFAGHIGFAEIISLYKCADVFLCMSEHEGFCVPLVEAMHFEVPIIAYAATAVPETLSGSSLLVRTKEPAFVAALIDRVVRNRALRRQLIVRQSARLQAFQPHVPSNWLTVYFDRKGQFK